MSTELDKTLRAAITQRRIVEFSYGTHRRTVEPHDYGVHKGVRKVLCYQIEGRSGSGEVPDWRTFMLDGIEGARITDARFAGSRPVGGKHMDWDELFASVSREAFKRRR